MKRILSILIVFAISFISSAFAHSGGFFQTDFPWSKTQQILVITSMESPLMQNTAFATLLTPFRDQIRYKLEDRDFSVTMYQEYINQKHIYSYPGMLLPESVLGTDLNQSPELYPQSPIWVDPFDIVLVAHINDAHADQQTIPGQWIHRPIIHPIIVRNKEGHIVDYQTFVDYDDIYIEPKLVAANHLSITFTLINPKNHSLIGRYAYITTDQRPIDVVTRKIAGDFAKRLYKQKKNR